jgi:tyrosinase
MSVVRRNATTDPTACSTYCQGVLALKQEHLPGITTTDFGIPGPDTPVSTYDLFVIWHQLAMMHMTPPDQRDRNAAHSGPAFLPWHRLMLVLLELQLQRVLGDNTVALPYWDWAADGDQPPAQQSNAALWDAAHIGGNGSPIASGPFRPGAFTVHIETTPTGQLRQTNRSLRRELALDAPSLPTTADVNALLHDGLDYDATPWDRSTAELRNRLEGWWNGPQLHNLIHVWIGGDMGPATSPNDPAFYLNHCNVDRIWEAWMTSTGRNYAPPANAAASLTGHRLDDALYSVLIQQAVTPADVLDISSFYSYDQLP